MNRHKSFRFAVLGALLVATALPASAKPGPDEDCDSAGGEIAMQGDLKVQSITPLSSCLTQIEVSGIVSVVSRTYTTDSTSTKASIIEQQEKAELSLTITVITTPPTSTDGGEPVTSVCMSKGTVKFFNETKGFGRMLDVSGVITGPDGQFTGTLEGGKKGPNAVNVRQAFMAGMRGSVYFNPKEITIDKPVPASIKGHTYIGTVTIVK